MLTGKFYATFSCSPFFNMAMDEWMFHTAGRNCGLIFLRLYSWKSGAITIGRNQDQNKAVNSKKLDRTPLIRRITGGRALYHDQSELTYSLVANCAGNQLGTFGKSVSQASRTISTALLDFLAAMEIKAHYVRQSSATFLSGNSFHTLPCFDSKARHEIIGDRGKLVASAQRRIGDVFLQHGSIKLNGVAEHPALNLTATNSLDSSNLQPLTYSNFEEACSTFCYSIGKSLGIEFSLEMLNEVDLMEISAFEESVKKNCLIQRDLIKQNLGFASLSGELHN